MTVPIGLLALVAVCPFLTKALDTPSSCQLQHATRPSYVFNGKPFRIDLYPPPYSFTFTDSLGSVTKEYNENVHTIRVSGTVPFRGFVVAARLVTQDGILVGDQVVGHFIPDGRWEKDGVTFDQCSPQANSSITHSGDSEKYSLEAKWQTVKDEGAIQFIITIIQSPDLYWTQWQPSSGFVLPSKSAQFGNNASTEEEKVESIEPQYPFNADAISETTEASANKADESLEGNGSSDDDTPEEIERSDSGGQNDGYSGRQRFNISLNSGRLFVRVVDRGEGNEQVEAPPLIPLPATAEAIVLPHPPAFRPAVGTSEEEYEDEENGSDGTQTSSGQGAFPEPPVEPTAATPELTTDDPADRSVPCDARLCHDNGECKIFPNADDYTCICTELWAGEKCDEPNHCIGHRCEHDAICISNGDYGNYTCYCRGQWGGKYCERPCPHDICQNGGKCTIHANDSYGCVCTDGYTGQFCELSADDCVRSDCLNGATCVDKHKSFECHCAAGYMGKRCEKRCRDFYKSCSAWGDLELCNLMRPETNFYDINCPVTCGLCEYNETVANTPLLPPVLEPFAYLLGKWTWNSTRPYRFPLDFANTTEGYYEVLEITLAEVPMFGTPSINFLSRARNNMDHTDEHVTVGFLTLGPGTNPLKVSLMSTGNDGMTILEEGTMDGTKIDFEMVYIATSPGVENIAPIKAKRRLAIKGPYLQEIVERHRSQGQKDYFTKYFYRDASSDN